MGFEMVIATCGIFFFDKKSSSDGVLLNSERHIAAKFLTSSAKICLLVNSLKIID